MGPEVEISAFLTVIEGLVPFLRSNYVHARGGLCVKYTSSAEDLVSSW